MKTMQATMNGRKEVLDSVSDDANFSIDLTKPYCVETEVERNADLGAPTRPKPGLV